jgi:hypothetical protein
MTATLTQPPVTDAQRITDLENRLTSLAALVDQYRREQCMVRSLEDIWAGTQPGYLAPRRRPDLRVVTGESCRQILEAARP